MRKRKQAQALPSLRETREGIAMKEHNGRSAEGMSRRAFLTGAAAVVGTRPFVRLTISS